MRLPFPHPTRYPAPFSDLWALLLCRVLEEGFSSWLGEVFSYQGPAVTPKKGTPVDCVLWGAAEFPTRRGHALSSPCCLLFSSTAPS